MSQVLNILMSIVTNHAVPFVLRLIGAAVILFVGFKTVKFCVKKLAAAPFFTKLDTNIQGLIKNATKVIANTIIAIVAIEIIGVPSATIIGVLGSCGLAIGLALQGGLSNLAGGVIIMLFKPFHEGNYISTPMGDGTVADIGVFYTKLTTPDNINIKIPNSALANSTISNYSEHPTRRVDIALSISYEADVDLAKKILLVAADSHDLILKDPAPVIYVTEQADSSINLSLRVWTKTENYWTVKFDLMEDSKKVLDKFNISIPYPQLDVHVKND